MTGTSEAANQQDEERAVTAIMWAAMRTAGKMPADGRGLFRRKLSIQIFPQSLDDFGTFHSHTFLMAQVRLAHGHAQLNSAPSLEVPHR